MYKICIIDEDKVTRDRLNEMVKQYGGLNNLEFDIYIFQNATSYLNTREKDSCIIFLDIDTSKMDGMQLVRKIRKTRPDVVIIICTRLLEFAVKGYEMDVLGFIVKPIQWNSVQLFVDKAMKKLTRQQDEALNIIIEEKSIRVSDISYVEIRGHYLLYYIREDGENPKCVIQTRGSMQDAERQLEQYDLYRCHLSYLVNLKHVTSITGNEVYINKTRLPISRNYKISYTKAFSKFISKKYILMQ